MADQIVLNGINPLTGQYLVPPFSLAAAARLAAFGTPSPAQSTKLAISAKLARRVLGLPFGIDCGQTGQAGWGLVFHAQEDPAVLAALEPLYQHRLSQIGPGLVKKLAYKGDTYADWLAGYGVSTGSVVPGKIPFYLLLAGDPSKIPFDFGHLLAMEYAVGRLCLDTPADYQRYVTSLIEYETSGGATNTKDVVFFGPQHINDEPTRLSAEELIAPLADGHDGSPGVAGTCQFTGLKIAGRNATKTSLLAALKRSVPPALLFTAGHGLGWPAGDAMQAPAQGALLCSDWKGLGFSPIPITPDNFFAASDLDSTANLRHLVAFCFACFGAGTPDRDRFAFDPALPPQQLAPEPFFSSLPKAMLSHSNGPALAVIGHVERAWPSSISPPGAGPQLQPFENAIRRILTGAPLGLALTDFEDRFRNYSVSLTELQENQADGLKVDPGQIAADWTQRNDAKAYVLLGDPAVKLRPDKVQASHG